MKSLPGRYLLLSFLFFTACKTHHTKTEIIAASNQYDRFIQQMQVDSIASLFSPKGSLGDIATGRDSIKHFLQKFKGIQVVLQQSTTDSIALFTDSATQSGKYRQTDILPNTDTVHVAGKFMTQWIWLDGEGWRIQKITTVPDK